MHLQAEKPKHKRKAWRHVALRVSDAQLNLEQAEAQEAPEGEYRVAVEVYRGWLERLAQMVASELDKLPEPVSLVPAQEKAAGYVSEPWRSGA